MKINQNGLSSLPKEYSQGADFSYFDNVIYQDWKETDKWTVVVVMNLVPTDQLMEIIGLLFYQ